MLYSPEYVILIYGMLLRGNNVCFFVPESKEKSTMPKNQFERMMFALMTVIVTVHAYVFYSIYVGACRSR